MKILIVTWDGAGNLVPTLSLARRLARAGHDVRLLGHRSIERRCGTHGWRFRPFVRTMDVDSAAAADGRGDGLRLARELWFASSVVEDVREELADRPADVVIADCMLFGALSAAQAARVPTVALFHGAFTLFRTGPFAALLSTLLPELNRMRRDLGLKDVPSVSDVHDACTLSFVATPQEFELPLPVPTNVRFAGPLLDAPLMPSSPGSHRVDADFVSSIVVSLSTSDQGQLPVLQRLVSVLSSIDAPAIVTTGPAIDPAAVTAAENVRIARYVPHDRLLPRAPLVVTHGGLGTVMSSLAHGVPLLCLPFGRDQFFNAARVQALGVGRTIARDADPAALRAAIVAMLEDDGVRASAAAFARVIEGYRDGQEAVHAVQSLVRDSAAWYRPGSRPSESQLRPRSQ